MTQQLTILHGKGDRFSGVTVHTENIPTCSDAEFEIIVQNSLLNWKQNKKRGIWILIPIENSSFIPILVKNGFVFHHAKPRYVCLTNWLPNEPNKLPHYPSTNIGVGGLVFNDKNEVLVVKEKYLIKGATWKLPGGLVEHGEEIHEAAIREVLEETSIKTIFSSILLFRSGHHYLFDTSDIYFVCRLQPINFDIKIDTGELSEGRWMPVQEYLAIPEISPLNREAVSRAAQSQDAAVDFYGGQIPSFNRQSLQWIFNGKVSQTKL